MTSIRLGVIGYGRRIRHIIDLITRMDADAAVAAITDVRNDAIREQMRAQEQDFSSIAFYDDPDAMLDRERLDGVLIGTRCGLHARMAVKVLERGLPLFLEKPVATTFPDLRTLREAGAGQADRVVVSFPLRVTPLVRLAKEIIDSGQIGTVEHVQAWNNVPYGSGYYQGWYRDENETQGLFLQKATHDFDYINFLLGLRPRWISAMTSKQIFTGNHPAGLRCVECEEQQTCAESPFHVSRRLAGERPERSSLLCAFAVDTGNEDSGSALIQYESGMHVCYSQNFFARKKAAKRGATLLGYKGTLEFDWYTDTLTVVMHHTPRVETHQIDSGGSHGGGDAVLADNFVRVVRAEEPSVAPLDAGTLSVLMCLKAKESAATRTFQEIPASECSLPVAGEAKPKPALAGGPGR